jgi:hypothetical protein
MSALPRHRSPIFWSVLVGGMVLCGIANAVGIRVNEDFIGWGIPLTYAGLETFPGRPDEWFFSWFAAGLNVALGLGASYLFASYCYKRRIA